MGIHDVRIRLNAYVKDDVIYNDYIHGRLNENDLSDFDRFCIQHCEDIKELLAEVKRLSAAVYDSKRRSKK